MNDMNIKYLIIGNGQLAKHLRHYFGLLNIAFHSWDRTQNLEKLSDSLKTSTHVLLAISDSAIEGFVQSHLIDFQSELSKKIIHFSGALHLPGLISCHPLMSFGPELYSLDLYKKIHFMITGSPDLSSVLPELPNSFSLLPAEKKALYHAWCVMGGNLPVILWSKMSRGLREMGVPEKAEHLYLQQVLNNYFAFGEKALTGPIVRKDLLTIEKNQQALPIAEQKIYSAFVENDL